MKRSKLKALIISGMLITVAIMGIQGNAFAQNNVSSSETQVNIQKDKSDISKSLEAIRLQKENIKYLNERYKNNKAKGDEVAMVADKKDLRKAEADLCRDEAYLKANKMNLIDDHNLVIKARKDAIKRDQADINAAKKKLDKDLAAGKETVAAKNAVAIAQCQKELDNDKAMLHKEKINKNNDIVAVNKKIDKVEAQSEARLYAENAVANTKNWIEK